MQVKHILSTVVVAATAVAAAPAPPLTTGTSSCSNCDMNTFNTKQCSAEWKLQVKNCTINGCIDFIVDPIKQCEAGTSSIQTFFVASATGASGTPSVINTSPLPTGTGSPCYPCDQIEQFPVCSDESFAAIDKCAKTPCKNRIKFLPNFVCPHLPFKPNSTLPASSASQASSTSQEKRRVTQWMPIATAPLSPKVSPSSASGVAPTIPLATGPSAGRPIFPTSEPTINWSTVPHSLVPLGPGPVVHTSEPVLSGTGIHTIVPPMNTLPKRGMPIEIIPTPVAPITTEPFPTTLTTSTRLTPVAPNTTIPFATGSIGTVVPLPMGTSTGNSSCFACEWMHRVTPCTAAYSQFASACQRSSCTSPDLRKMPQINCPLEPAANPTDLRLNSMSSIPSGVFFSGTKTVFPTSSGTSSAALSTGTLSS